MSYFRKVLIACIIGVLVFSPVRELLYILIGGNAPKVLLYTLKYGLDLLLAALVVVSLGLAAQRRSLPTRSRVVLLSWAVAGWALLSVLWSWAGVVLSFRGFRIDFAGLLVLSVLAILRPTKQERKRVLIGIAGFFSLLLMASIPDIFANHAWRVWAHQDLVRHIIAGIPQIRSLTPGPNSLGSLLVLGSGIALWRLRGRQLYMALAILGVLLGMTQARSAWLGAITLIAGMSLDSLRAKKSLLAPLVLGIMTLLGSATMVLAYHAPIRMVFLHGESTQEHIEMGSGAIGEAVTQPAGSIGMGSGIGTAGPAQIGTKATPRISESWYIQIFQELGLIGLALYIALYFAVIRELFKRHLRPLAWLSIGLGINAIFLHTWSSDYSLNVIFWGVIGLALFTRTSDQPTKQPA